MRYRAHMYAKALAEAIVGKGVETHEAIAKNFVALVRKNGDDAHLRKIVEEAARLIHGRAGVRKITLESARPLRESQKKVVRGFLRSGDIIHEQIVPELIAGIKVIVNDELQFDNSLKHKLDILFKN